MFQKLVHKSNSDDSWKHVLEKIPFDIVNEIGKGVIEFQSVIEKDHVNVMFVEDLCYFLHSPLYITSGLGLLN